MSVERGMIIGSIIGFAAVMAALYGYDTYRNWSAVGFDADSRFFTLPDWTSNQLMVVSIVAAVVGAPVGAGLGRLVSNRSR